MEIALSVTKCWQRRRLVSVKFKVGQRIIHESLLHTRLNDAKHKIFLKMSVQILSDFSKFFKNYAPTETTLSEIERRHRLRLVRLSAVSVCI